MNDDLDEMLAREAVVKHWIWGHLSKNDQDELINTYNSYYYGYTGKSDRPAESMIRRFNKRIKQ